MLVISSTDHMGLSAGADVKEDLDRDGAVRKMELFAQLYDEVVGFPQPTIAACHGACVGGGAEIAVACDLRIGGSNMRLRFPGAALGVPVGPARLVTLCGLSVAKYALLTSKEISADQALRWGLVHKVAPAPATEEAALTLAAHMSTMPPESLRRIKSMLHSWDDVVGRSADEGQRPGRLAERGPRPRLPGLTRRARAPLRVRACATQAEWAPPTPPRCMLGPDARSLPDAWRKCGAATPIFGRDCRASTARVAAPLISVVPGPVRCSAWPALRA